jgi:hypothetical protein
LLAKHTRKCLKVEYLSQIINDFQKSRGAGPWDQNDIVSAKKVKKKCHACVTLRENAPFSKVDRLFSIMICCLLQHYNQHFLFQLCILTGRLKHLNLF